MKGHPDEKDAASAEQLIRRLENIAQWQSGEQRAPHKPLLMLLMLARIQQGKGRLATFPEIESELEQLLKTWGPPRRSVHPEYPFWHLQRDGFWEVQPKLIMPTGILSNIS